MKPKRIDSLKRNYRKVREVSMIAILVIFIILFQVVRVDLVVVGKTFKIDKIKIEVIQIPKTWQKKKIRRPKAPARPSVPVPMEEEYIPEDLTIVPTKLDLSNIPPPPPPPLIEYDYDNYSFIPYQIPPKIIGGMRGIRKQTKFPNLAKRVGISGKTIVGLLIDKRGNVIKCVLLKSAGPGLYTLFDEEALRVSKKIKFKPAFQRDKPVKIWLKIPFIFRLK